MLDKAQSSMQSRPPLALTILIVGYLTLAGLRYHTDFASSVALIALSCYVFMTRKGGSQRRLVDMQLVLLFLLLVSSFLAWSIGAMQTGTVGKAVGLTYILIAGSAILLWVKSQSLSLPQLRGCLFAVLDGVAIYLVACVVAHFVLGLDAPSDRFRAPAVSALSWFDTRVSFPLSDSLSVPPTLASAYAACFLFYWRADRPTAGLQLLRLTGVVCSVLVILAAGARLAPAAAVPIVIVTLLNRPLMVRWAGALAVTSLLLPLWWSSLGGVLAAPLGQLEAIPFFAARDDTLSGREEVASLNQRTHIWQAVSTHAQDATLGHFIFGYGPEGQRVSGMSRETAYLFEFMENPEEASTHSGVLQQFVDQGLLGALILLATFATTMAALSRIHRLASSPEERGVAVALSVLLLVLAFSAGLDQILSSGKPTEPFWAFWIAAFFISEYRVRLEALASPAVEVKVRRSTRLYPRGFSQPWRKAAPAGSWARRIEESA